MRQCDQTARAQPRQIDIIGAQGAHSPFIFCSPHSGRRYDPRFLAQCQVSVDRLRHLEDSYVDLLFMDVPAHGAPLLSALFPRAFVDVNRDRHDLDPLLVDGLPPRGEAAPSLQLAAGYGVLPRNTHDGSRIYRQMISRSAAMQRLQSCYDPYHRALQGLIHKTCDRFGFAILIDCHSMPSTSRPGPCAMKVDRHSPATQPGADIVLGDRYGTSCDPALTTICEDIFNDLGFRVRRNFPYAGGYITRRYGQPRIGVHVIQIEINRRLYLDESRIVRHEGYDDLRYRLKKFVHMLVRHKSLSSLGRQLLGSSPAAE